MNDTTERRVSLPSRDTMVAAFLNRDSHYEGVFFTGVKTTGIFCRPTCRARKPKPENVDFFRSTGEALNAGYRPCKVCRPMEPAGASPKWIRKLLRRLESADYRITDGDLRGMGLVPATVRRWFQKHHGMTFHAYARHLRIGRAYGTIRHETSVTEAAFANGYESLSGFGDAFKRGLGFTPSQSGDQGVALFTRVPTPFGPMVAVAVDDQLHLLEFTDRPMLETQLDRVRKGAGVTIVPW
jgi:AraC family transcriptional regulator of adaptative response/methylated-DNA-[protein]-cysteine methyltransferase